MPKYSVNEKLFKHLLIIYLWNQAKFQYYVLLQFHNKKCYFVITKILLHCGRSTYSIIRIHRDIEGKMWFGVDMGTKIFVLILILLIRVL